MKWYRNLKISAKLIIGFLVVAAIAVVVGIVGLVNIFEINEGSDLLFKQNTLGLEYVGDSYSDFERLRYNALKSIIVDTKEEKAETIGKVEELCTTIDGLLLNYKNTIDTEEEASLYEHLSLSWEEYKGYMEDAVKYSDAGQDSMTKKLS